MFNNFSINIYGSSINGVVFYENVSVFGFIFMKIFIKCFVHSFIRIEKKIK